MAGLTERLLQEGMQQGMQKGSLSVLLRLITRHFGPLDSSTEQRLKQATTQELECWSDNILDAQTLDDVFACR